MVIAVSAAVVGLMVAWLGNGNGNAANTQEAVEKKPAEMPLVTRLNYPNKEKDSAGEGDALWNVSSEREGLQVTHRRPEVRAVLRKRPAASEDMGGMPTALREKLENTEVYSIPSLLPHYQQWGLRNGPSAVMDALDRMEFLGSEKPLVSAFHGWIVADKAGPDRWLRTFEATDSQKEKISEALLEARGW